MAPEVVATARFFETDIYGLAGLLRLGDEVWSWGRRVDDAAANVSPDK